MTEKNVNLDDITSLVKDLYNELFVSTEKIKKTSNETVSVTDVIDMLADVISDELMKAINKEKTVNEVTPESAQLKNTVNNKVINNSNLITITNNINELTDAVNKLSKAVEECNNNITNIIARVTTIEDEIFGEDNGSCCNADESVDCDCEEFDEDNCCGNVCDCCDSSFDDEHWSSVALVLGELMHEENDAFDNIDCPEDEYLNAIHDGYVTALCDVFKRL